MADNNFCKPGGVETSPEEDDENSSGDDPEVNLGDGEDIPPINPDEYEW